jgi:heme exporter protein D
MFIVTNAVLGFALLGVVLALLLHAMHTERNHRPILDEFTARRAARRARHAHSHAGARRGWQSQPASSASAS